MKKIAVLVSGSGSNLQALIDADLAQSNGQIVGVISNRTDAYALQRAQQAHIATCVISHRDYPSREDFDAALHQQLVDWHVDLVVLAGFMRILTAQFVEQWRGKMLNIHPSLLPAYKGLHTHQRVLASGDKQHGCTVHVVTPELDDGAAIIQGILNVNVHDNADTLAQRVHQLEHLIYPLAIHWLCNQQLIIQKNQILLNRKPLLSPLRLYL